MGLDFALTIRYPPTQPVTIMPMAIETLADPNVLLTTVGMVAKKPPFEAPLTTTKTASGASEVDAGHSVSMLIAVSMREPMSVLRGPNTSQKWPQMMRPTADEKLNAARSPAPVLEDSPMERL